MSNTANSKIYGIDLEETGDDGLNIMEVALRNAKKSSSDSWIDLSFAEKDKKSVFHLLSSAGEIESFVIDDSDGLSISLNFLRDSSDLVALIILILMIYVFGKAIMILFRNNFRFSFTLINHRGVGTNRVN